MRLRAVSRHALRADDARRAGEDSVVYMRGASIYASHKYDGAEITFHYFNRVSSRVDKPRANGVMPVIIQGNMVSASRPVVQDAVGGRQEA